MMPPALSTSLLTKPPLYRYAVEQCDVEDQEGLKAFRAKRTAWINLLQDDPTHSVSSQLSSLLWQDATFHLFNEMRRLIPQERTTAMRAPLLAEALDNGYVTNMVLGIGRLTDPQSANPKKGVVSLRRVFNDVRDCRGLISREIYVCHDGLPYDPSTVPPPWERGVRPGAIIQGAVIGGPLDGNTTERLHGYFDGLAGKTPTDRTRTDQISDSIFAETEALLTSPAIKKVRDLRNKFVAHAADATSRATVALSGFSISMADVETALRALLRAHDKISSDLLWSSGGGLMPTAQFDVLEGLTEGLTDEELAELRAVWARLVDERDEWHK